MTAVDGGTGGALVVAALRAHAVDTVFGIPGTHSLEIYRALAGTGIRHVTPRHEQGAGYAADGYARVGGRPGVAIVTTGPAVLNIATAVGQAYSDSVPLLVISPGMPTTHPAHGTGLLHETKNQSAALDAVAGYSHRVASHAEIPVAIARAFASFRAGRPRPVHVEIPLDLLGTAAPGPVPVPGPIRTGRRCPDPELLDAATVALDGAHAPVVIVGGGARAAAASVLRLAEILAAPVLSTTNGKGIVPEDHPLAVTSALHLPSVRDFVDSRDVVVAVGTELSETDFWAGPPRWLARLIRIDADPGQLAVNAVPDIGIVGDAEDALAALLERLTGRRAPATAADDAAGATPTAAGAAAIRAEAASEGARWIRWLDAIAAALPRHAIVAADNAMACYYGALGNLRAYRPGGFLFPTGFGTLGFAVPAGIGAALADPAAAVVALSGDGGLMFSVSELATAAAEQICLPVIVFSNGGYGEIRDEMRAGGIEPIAVDLPEPDFATLAIAMGGRGRVAGSPQALAEALADALSYPGPTVIVVPDAQPPPEDT